MNTPLRSRAKTFIAKANRLMAENELEAAEKAAHDATVALDKAAQKGALHPNNAARRKSRLMKQLHRSKQT